MRFKPKKIQDQVIVITGASSGIGLATAKLAAQRGARVVLSSRNESALRQTCDEILRHGGRCIHVVADVANVEEVERIAQAAEREFGGFDTWINNAGVSIYGRLETIKIEEKRRLFDVNFWGVVHGCKFALKHF